ncbi:MAG: PqqD family peptide modification chaperone [Oscillospiraceae bacterium]
MSGTIDSGQVPAEVWIQAVEPLLAQGHSFRVCPKGDSMFPFLISGRDSALLGKKPAEALRRGDIVLFQRPDRSLILHRIIRRKNGVFFIVGDNETDIEGPVYPEQIKAAAVSIVRDGRDRLRCMGIPVCSGLWFLLRRFRPARAAAYRVIQKTVTARRNRRRPHGRNRYMKIKSGYLLRNVAAVNIIVPVGERVIDFKGLMTFNETGAFLWRLLQQETDERALVQALMDQYEVDLETARADVAEFVASVREAGALE